MRIRDFDIYKDLLKEKSGLRLTPDKSYMLDSRLGPIAKKWGYFSVDSMTVALQAVPDKNLVGDIVEAMTSPETSFFRDMTPFDFFRDFVLPAMLKSRKTKKRFRVWSAGCSTGQEPYSLAMMIQESKIAGWRNEILATDISNEALAQARNGVYSQFEVQRGLSAPALLDCFAQDGTSWKISDALRKMVKFEYMNLLDGGPGKEPFDVIFCRNVLTHIEDDLRPDILEGMAQHLAPDGFLFLGFNESAVGLTEALRPLTGWRGIYVTKDSPHSA